jgi:hypothetical protein
MTKGVMCMRFGLVALVALLSPIIASVQTLNPRISSDSTPEIELKLVPEKGHDSAGRNTETQGRTLEP